ncbi:MAG: ABC transporter substrate-binding protein [Candidatus Faecalibacterium intestinavium]|uniref:ABC transporter substrate-binding protein n=1 Tax=Candidatus Faecalibacterium intestinavium TaxID=2838580 RepID=A0A9E2NRY6_9FIRM|nr:ABC transporter substrate-binding protein [Candidatus Faecalibacterium intestinavium]
MKKITRRAFLAGLAAVSAAGVLSACGGGSETASTAASAAGGAASAEGGHKLTAYAWDASFNIPALNAAAADYKANVDPDFELEVIEQSQSSDVENAITLAASAGDYSTLPDIVLFQDHYIQKYVTDYPDAFVPVEGADIDWSGISEEKLSYSVIDGTHYGVPVDNGTVIFAYRTDLLEQAGYTIDDMTGISWADFIKVGEDVFAATGKYLVSMDGDGNDLIYMMMQAEGQSQFKDGEPYITGNDTLRQICEVIVEMVQKNVCYLANDWSGYINQTILGDMVAGVMNGNWIIPTIRQVPENSGKWEITTLPTLAGGEGYASNGGSSLYITANCGNVDLAKAFLAYTFGGSTVTYDAALRDGGVITTVLACGESEVYNEGVEYFNNTPIYKQIVEMGGNVPVVEQSDYHYRARTYLAAGLINVINGANLDDELANAEQQIRFEMGL